MTLQMTLMQRHLPPTETLLTLVAPSGAALSDFPHTDWHALLALASRHSLAPLLHARLLPTLERLPEEVRHALRRAHTESAAHTMFQEWEQAQLVRRFQGEGIPLILFKGIPLARWLFGDPALRPTVDIDVLVHEADMEASCALVEGMGWQVNPSYHAFTDKNYDYLKEIDGATLHLEIHWNNQRRGEYDLPEARLWEEATETADGYFFSREMTLLALVLHTVRHGFRPYRQLVDIAHAVAAWNDALEWPRVIALADEAEALPLLATVLALVERDLGAPSPAHEGLAQRLHARRTQLALRLLTPQRLLLAPSLGAVERYWVPLVSGAWQPARFFVTDFLRTPAQIADIYHLPPNSPLIPLFYLLRPFLLAKKYAQRLNGRQ